MFELFNETNKKIEELEYLEEYVKYVSAKEKIEDAIFNIIFVEQEEIQKINREYRNQDKVTDVISFALEDSSDVEIPLRVLGDIYICLDKAIMQAKEYGHSLKRELAFLITHGLLHLLGFDHMKEDEEKIMFKKQEELLDSYGIKK